jgi:hypothetical protein
MVWFARVMLVVGLGAGSLAHAEASAVIWGGGTTAEAAEQAAEAYESQAVQWRDFVTLAAGFPQVIASDTLPGLKSGFFVVLLGVCTGAPGAAVEAIDAFAPATYTRAVSWDQPDACPKVRPRIEFDDVGYELGPVVRVSAQGTELSAFLLTTHQPEGSEAELRGWSLYVFLRKGPTTQTQVLHNEGTDFATVTPLVVEGGALTFEESYAAPSCVTGSRFVEYRRTWRVEAKAGRLRAPTPKAKEVKRGACGQ